MTHDTNVCQICTLQTSRSLATGPVIIQGPSRNAGVPLHLCDWRPEIRRDPPGWPASYDQAKPAQRQAHAHSRSRGWRGSPEGADSSHVQSQDLGLSRNRGTPQWLVRMENPTQMDDNWGYPYCGKPPFGDWGDHLWKQQSSHKEPWEVLRLSQFSQLWLENLQKHR